jgi:AbrB family looped-hinge helix DNA binding protein
MNNIVTTSPKGQVVIPVEIRNAIGLESGQKVRVELKDSEVVIKPLPKDPIKSLRGKFSSSPSMTQSLLKDRKEDALREERKAARFVCDSGMASE